jgi:REP element-mobilizing transposase RayT
MEDHLHIVTHIHPTIALATLVKEINVSSTTWIKNEKIFPDFRSWQLGYGAFTYSIKEKEALLKYIKTQKEHHKIKTFKEEYIGRMFVK